MKRAVKTLVDVFKSEGHTWKKIYILLALVALMAAAKLIVELVG